MSPFFVGEENPACTSDKEEIPLKNLGKYLLLSLTLFPPGKNPFCYYICDKAWWKRVRKLPRILICNFILASAIFQTFWKDDCCTKSLFLELETSNFG